MAEIVNLKRFKKRVARTEADAKAAENRSKYGRSKAEKLRDETVAQQEERLLDQHRLECRDKP